MIEIVKGSINHSDFIEYHCKQEEDILASSIVISLPTHSMANIFIKKHIKAATLSNFARKIISNSDDISILTTNFPLSISCSYLIGAEFEIKNHTIQHNTRLINLSCREHDFEVYNGNLLDVLEVSKFSQNNFSNLELDTINKQIQESSKSIGILKYDSKGIVAAGLTYLTDTDTSSIIILGVRKELRGKGLGNSLHSALMKEASKFSTNYVGLTDIDNKPMIKIMKNNGCLFQNEQVVYAVICNPV